MTPEQELISFDQFITHWAVINPTGPAMAEYEHIQTWQELEENTARVASALLAAGLTKGDRVAWLGKNSDLYFTLFYGAARLGVVMVPVGWRLAPAEIAYIVNDTKARILFTGPGFDEAAAAIKSDLPLVEQIIGADQAWAMIADTPRRAFTPAGADDAILQLYTSGTTGKPKGAVLSNRNLFGLRRPSLDAAQPWSQWEDHEVVMVAMPCAHIGGTGLGTMAVAAGRKAQVIPEFSPDAVFDAVEKYGVTRFFIVPAALQMLLLHPRCPTVDYSGLKYIIYGAAPIPLELLRQSVEMFGAQFLQAYGMTETTGTIAMLPPDDHDVHGNPRMRSAGKAVPGVELKIVDENDGIQPANTVGELMIRSSSNMLGYWNLPEATANTMTPDGWVRTGDAAYIDEDGYLYIHDRVKDMIISGGENVYPAEVESAIYGHPDVQEVAVIGVPCDTWGESVKACVVAKPGHDIDPDSIITWARDKIAAFKAPKSVDVIPMLPRNASGKILRRELRAPYWEGRDRNVN